MIILITGSRKFTDVKLMYESLLPYAHNNLFRHGGANGADKMVSVLFPERIERVFIPDWKRYGRGAGLKRNIEMLDADPIPMSVIAFFYQTRSGGTLHTVNQAYKREIAVLEYIQDDS